MSGLLVEADEISKSYGSIIGKGRTVVLSGCSLALSAGESVGLMGPSGSGKSTFARIITGLEHPDTGSIRYCGVVIRNGDYNSRRIFRRSIQMLFQDPGSAFHPMRTIERSLDQVLSLYDVPHQDRIRLVQKMLIRVGIHQEVLSRVPDQISGGQAQRLALARILLINPGLIVLDEPTSGLDISAQAQILNLLKEVQEQTGVAYLLISHDEDVIHFMTERSYVIKEGKLMRRSVRNLL